jgi:hypothetical protein
MDSWRHRLEANGQLSVRVPLNSIVQARLDNSLPRYPVSLSFPDHNRRTCLSSIIASNSLSYRFMTRRQTTQRQDIPSILEMILFLRNNLVQTFG